MASSLDQTQQLLLEAQDLIQSLTAADIQQALHNNGYEKISVKGSKFVKVGMAGFNEAYVFEIRYTDSILTPDGFEKAQQVFLWYSPRDKQIVAHF